MVVVSEQSGGSSAPQCECVLACAAYEEGVTMWLFNVLVVGGGSTGWWGSHGQEGVQHDVLCAGDEQGVTVQCTIMVLLVPVAGGDSRAGRERHSHLGTVASCAEVCM